MCQYTKEDEVGPKIEPRGQFEERFRDTVSRVQDCTVYETSPAEKCQSYLTGERRMAVPYVSTQGPPHKGSPIRDRPFPNTKIIGIIDKKSKYLPHELPPPKIPSPPHLLTTALRVPTHPPPRRTFFFGRVRVVATMAPIELVTRSGGMAHVRYLFVRIIYQLGCHGQYR